MKRLVVIATMLAALVGLTGCAEQDLVYSQQERVIPNSDPNQTLLVAATILQREFGRLNVDADARRIETSPVEFTTQRESGTARDLYRGRSTMRRKATMTIAQRGETTVARLRVDVERLDTHRQTVMHPRGYRLTDNPGAETPIYADAATSEEQNTVWTRVRRDRRLERALLEELREQMARSAAGSEVGQPPTTQDVSGEQTR